jgi:ferritin-like metal-binding protein YciE
MTITEALMIPKGMTFEEYEKLLKDKRKLEKQIAKAGEDMYCEIDCLETLSDEVGSERYNKHLQAKLKAESKMENALHKLSAITIRLTTV